MALETTPLLNHHFRRWTKYGLRLALLPILFAIFVNLTYWVFIRNAYPIRTMTANTMRLEFCDSTMQSSGYIRLPHKLDDHYFYWFFESRSNPRTDPLILWLEGGPGTSSIWALLNENGPCSIGEDGNSTTFNPYSWTNHANVIWLDQPTGVGFSYGATGDDDYSEEDVGLNIYNFLQGWFEKHPKYHSNPFYISGQSYGGHYVPAAASFILRRKEANTTTGEIDINLQGITIGNGLTDTVVQYPMLVDMVNNSYNITLVSPEEQVKMRSDAKILAKMVLQCQLPNHTQLCFDTDEFWDEKILEPMITNPARNMYDFRQLCDPRCDDLGELATTSFLNLNWVRQHLHVHEKMYQMSNFTVLDEFGLDEERNAVKYVAHILESKLRVLVNAGDADLVCDWKGNEAWTKKLTWHGHQAFNAASNAPFVVEGKAAGTVRSAEGFSFVRIYESGHCVPRDQPAVSLALITRFIHKVPLHNDN